MKRGGTTPLHVFFIEIANFNLVKIKCVMYNQKVSSFFPLQLRQDWPSTMQACPKEMT